jgi:hypothetical protein
MALGRKTGGRNFLKGHPPFRPAVPREIREGFDAMLRRHLGNGEILVEKLLEIASREARTTKDAMLAMQATLCLLAYLEGRPVQRQELSGPGGGPLDVSQMSSAELHARVLSLVGQWPRTSLAPGVAGLLPAVSASEMNAVGASESAADPEGM